MSRDRRIEFVPETKSTCWKKKKSPMVTLRSFICDCVSLTHWWDDIWRLTKLHHKTELHMSFLGSNATQSHPRMKRLFGSKTRFCHRVEQLKEITGRTSFKTSSEVDFSRNKPRARSGSRWIQGLSSGLVWFGALWDGQRLQRGLLIRIWKQLLLITAERNKYHHYI